MRKNGWIKIYRSILDCELWCDGEPFDKRSAWIDLLFMANYEDNVFYQGAVRVKLKKGQLFTSVRFLSERWHWGRHRVTSFLTSLSEAQMVTLKGTLRGTLITIENYTKYQSLRDAEGDAKGEIDRKNEGTNTKKNIKESIKNITKKDGSAVWGDSECE